ncbi:hypothetical protein F4Y93_06590, partial [Candidatus Poribacteria bacterium]|nr:hypothetical protein [Candidatus Poribacteria bacterium]
MSFKAGLSILGCLLSLFLMIGSVSANSAPKFADGGSTTRSVDENTPAGQNIGSPVSATDPDNDTLTYTLGGADRNSFDIESTSGQLKTKAALDHDVKDSYAVEVIASDGSLTNAIIVRIRVNEVTTTQTVSSCKGDVNGDGVVDAADLAFVASRFGQTDGGAADVNADGIVNVADLALVADDLGESCASPSTDSTPSTPAEVTTRNSAPEFADGSSTTRSVDENTPAGQNIGSPVSATDPDNDTLTYTLGGADRNSFDIESTSGQLKTKAALDHDVKDSYAVEVIASDGSLTNAIIVTINVREIGVMGQVSQTGGNYRVLTFYGQTTEVELADYLTPGQTGINFTLMSSDASRPDYYNDVRVENGKLVTESNTLGHVHGTGTQPHTVCTITWNEGNDVDEQQDLHLYTVSDRTPRALLSNEVSVAAVRATEVDIQVTVGAGNYIRLGWRKTGDLPIFRVVSLASSPVTLTIPGLEPETDYEIRVSLMTRQSFDLYRGGSTGPTDTLIPEITPASKWIRNLSGGGLGKSQTLTATTPAAHPPPQPPPPID